MTSRFTYDICARDWDRREYRSLGIDVEEPEPENMFTRAHFPPGWKRREVFPETWTEDKAAQSLPDYFFYDDMGVEYLHMYMDPADRSCHIDFPEDLESMERETRRRQREVITIDAVETQIQKLKEASDPATLEERALRARPLGGWHRELRHAKSLLYKADRAGIRASPFRHMTLESALFNLQGVYHESLIARNALAFEGIAKLPPADLFQMVYPMRSLTPFALHEMQDARKYFEYLERCAKTYGEGVFDNLEHHLQMKLGYEYNKEVKRQLGAQLGAVQKLRQRMFPTSP